METNSIISQIGNTPLVRLKQASELTGCNIYGKAEYFNPGESVKDRAALFIVEDAIKRKLISKGGTIVEGTAGTTGIGLASVCKEYGLIAGIHCGTAEYASKAIGWGYNLTTIGGDTRLLASAAAASVSSWRKLTGRKEKVQVTSGVY